MRVTQYTLCKKSNLSLLHELDPVHIYAILYDKSEESYTELLTAINNIPGYNFNPLSIITDFEQPLQKSFRTVFPGIDNSGCLFHFNQAVLRNVNSIGLKSAYEDKPVNPATGRRGASETKKHIRRACAFVPVQDVPAAWDEVSQQFRQICHLF